MRFPVFAETLSTNPGINKGGFTAVHRKHCGIGGKIWRIFNLIVPMFFFLLSLAHYISPLWCFCFYSILMVEQHILFNSMPLETLIYSILFYSISQVMRDEQKDVTSLTHWIMQRSECHDRLSNGNSKSVWGTTCSRFDESVKPREKNTG